MSDLIGNLLPKVPRGPRFEPGGDRIALPPVRIVGDAEEVVERDLEELEVADIENPDLGHVEGLDDVELLPHYGERVRVLARWTRYCLLFAREMVLIHL